MESKTGHRHSGTLKAHFNNQTIKISLCINEVFEYDPFSLYINIFIHICGGSPIQELHGSMPTIEL